MPWKGLHFNRSLDISSTVLRYVAPKVHIISHKNKQSNLWHKKYTRVPSDREWEYSLLPLEGGNLKTCHISKFKKTKTVLLVNSSYKNSLDNLGWKILASVVSQNMYATLGW